MRDRISAAVWFVAAASGTMAAAPAPAPAPSVAAAQPASPPAPAPAPRPRPVYQPVEFGRIVADLPAGSEWQELEGGLLCVRNAGRTADGGRKAFDIPSAREIFDKALADAGLRAGGAGVDDLFGPAPAAERTDLVISGVVTGLHEEICIPYIYRPSDERGALSMVVEWRLYSRSQNRVLAKVETAVNQTVDARPGGAAVLVHNAFAAAVERMAADPVMRRALRADVAAAASTPSILPTAQAPITLAGSLGAQPRGLSSAVDSVVLVMLPDGGHGSGFLVSKDGYLLTDQHVVGDYKTVKVRWSDGVVADAEVVRQEKGRDVALIKTDPRGHAPLPLRRALPDVGETVFAIGAPLDKDLQGTVMRGIVSAHRVQDGYELIQSDVNANMGMSGGPLLDEQGRVVALTESKRLAEDSRSKELNLSINYFTPVGDALKYLSASPQ